MKTDNTQVEGTKVTINTDNEESARRIGAAADRFRIEIEGKAAERIDLAFDKVADMMNVHGRPAWGAASWACFGVAAILAFLSFSRILPPIGVELGLIGVVLVWVVKLATGRWAKAMNASNNGAANFYMTIVLVGLLFDLGAAVFFQAAVSEDQKSGVVTVSSKIEDKERDVRDAQAVADELDHPKDGLNLLQMDIARATGARAKTKAGDDAGMTVGQAVQVGQPEYCQPAKERQFYIERYCADLFTLDRKLQQRKDWEAQIAKVNTLKAEVEKLRNEKPKQASGLVVGEKIARGSDNPWLRWIPGALAMIAINGFMVLITYAVTRDPKGEAPAGLGGSAKPASVR